MTPDKMSDRDTDGSASPSLSASPPPPPLSNAATAARWAARGGAAALGMADGFLANGALGLGPPGAAHGHPSPSWGRWPGGGLPPRPPAPCAYCKRHNSIQSATTVNSFSSSLYRGEYAAKRSGTSKSKMTNASQKWNLHIERNRWTSVKLAG